MPCVDGLAARASPEDVQVARQRLSLVVRHLTGALVADPRMCAATARVHPQDVLEAEVLAQRRVDDLDRHRDEAPALVADGGAGAACSHGIVVRQIDVENELFGNGSEGACGAQGLALAGVGGVDGSDFEARRVELDDVLAEPSLRVLARKIVLVLLKVSPTLRLSDSSGSGRRRRWRV